MVNPPSSALTISLCITLLIVVGGARLFGVKLNRRHALPIMTVMGAELTLAHLSSLTSFLYQLCS
jgi:hypothetical protein